MRRSHARVRTIAAKNYRRLAQPFLDRGIAVFIYDKRGCGDSTGAYVEAPDLKIPASDLLRCITAIKQRPEIDNKKIGVWRISQGGWVGPLAASQSQDIAFVIMISGPSISPIEQNLFDKGNQLKRHGLDEKEIEAITKLRRLVWTYLATGQGEMESKKAWDEAKKQPWFNHLSNEPPMGNRKAILKHPRMVHFAAHSNYDPSPGLATISVPVLAVFGGDDSIVPAERCVRVLDSLFEDQRKSLLTTKIFPGADHGIRVKSANGSRDFADGYWNFVLDWTTERIASIAHDNKRNSKR